MFRGFRLGLGEFSAKLHVGWLRVCVALARQWCVKLPDACAKGRGVMIAFDNSDLRDEHWQDALYVSNRLTRRIVAPTGGSGFNTVVLMQPYGAAPPLGAQPPRWVPVGLTRPPRMRKVARHTSTEYPLAAAKAPANPRAFCPL